MPKMSFRTGAIHFGVIFLVLVGLTVFASLSVFADKKLEGRPFTYLNELLSTSKDKKGPCYPIGDVNNDGKVNRADAQKILNHVAGKGTVAPYRERADVNKDGSITAVDAQLIEQYLAGSIKTFPACVPVVPVINSVTPNPIPVGVPTVIATFIKVSGTGFGSKEGKVEFLLQLCQPSETDPRCMVPDRIWNCDFSDSSAELKTTWTDTTIICMLSSYDLPANKTLKLLVHTSDNRVSEPFSIRTLPLPNPSAIPIISDDRCLVPPSIPPPSGCPTLWTSV